MQGTDERSRARAGQGLPVSERQEEVNYDTGPGQTWIGQDSIYLGQDARPVRARQWRARAADTGFPNDKHQIPERNPTGVMSPVENTVSTVKGVNPAVSFAGDVYERF